MAAILERPPQKQQHHCDAPACGVPATIHIEWKNGTSSYLCDSHAETAWIFKHDEVAKAERLDG